MRSRYTPTRKQTVTNRTVLVLLVTVFILGLILNNRFVLALSLEGFGIWLVVAAWLARRSVSNPVYKRLQWWGLAWSAFIPIVFIIELYQNIPIDILRGMIAVGSGIFLVSTLVARFLGRGA